MDYTQLEEKKYKLPFFVLAIVGWSILAVLSLSHYAPYEVGCVSTIYLFLVIGSLLVRTYCARNALYFIVFLFISMYAVPAKLLFFNRMFLSEHHQMYTYQTATYVTLLYTLFLLFVGLQITIPKRYSQPVTYKCNDYVYWLLFIVSFVGTIIFRKQGNIYAGEEVKASSANEYLLILYLLCFLYTGKSRKKKLLCYLLFGLYTVFTLMAGARIEIIMLFLMLLVVKLQYVISFKKLAGAAVIGIWGMSIIGSIRNNPTLLLQSTPMEILMPFNHATDTQASNEGDIYWASERMICLIQEKHLSTNERVESAGCYLLSPFVQTSILPPVAELTHYKTDIYTTGGGCLAPIYYYVLFGYPGILLLAWIFSKSMNRLSVSKLTPWKIYAILMVTTLPRWFAYSPLHLIKYCIWAIFVFALFLSLDYTIKKNIQS